MLCAIVGFCVCVDVGGTAEALPWVVATFAGVPVCVNVVDTAGVPP